MNLTLPSIGVMILNRNGRDWLGPLYESLRKQGYPRLKVYLVDNASTDDSVALTLAHYSEVKVLRFSENSGYCIAYNRAMPHAFADGCEWVVWANNDILLEPGCLLELAKTTIQSEDIGVVGPTFYAWDSNEPNYYMKGKHPAAIEPMENGSSAAFDVDWVEGSFLMVSAECVGDVGWLDPYLFFYWEETDFCRRARRKGWRVVLAPQAIARHYAGGWSSGNQENTNTANYLKSRNQYIYTLADPDRSFGYNLFKGFHLFLVLCKAAVRKSPAAVTYELWAFSKLIFELGKIMSKWHRDRRGLLPPPTTPEYAQVSLEIVDGTAAIEPVKS
jgi:GT2 family glycosyltransferase